MTRPVWRMLLPLFIIACWSAASAEGQQSSDGVLYVTVDVANVRSGPGTDHTVAFRVEWGEELVLLEQADGWARIKDHATGNAGWIHMELTSTTKPTRDGSGHYDGHAYTFRRDKNQYAVRFEPVLPRDDTTVIGAMMELINVVYGKHLLLELTPKLVAHGGTNLVQFKGVNHYYYFLLIKEDTGEVSSFSMWREAR